MSSEIYGNFWIKMSAKWNFITVLCQFLSCVCLSMFSIKKFSFFPNSTNYIACYSLSIQIARKPEFQPQLRKVNTSFSPSLETFILTENSTKLFMNHGFGRPIFLLNTSLKCLIANKPSKLENLCSKQYSTLSVQIAQPSHTNCKRNKTEKVNLIFKPISP